MINKLTQKAKELGITKDEIEFVYRYSEGYSIISNIKSKKIENLKSYLKKQKLKTN